jgi:hypothetical protein
MLQAMAANARSSGAATSAAPTGISQITNTITILLCTELPLASWEFRDGCPAPVTPRCAWLYPGCSYSLPTWLTVSTVDSNCKGRKRERNKADKVRRITDEQYLVTEYSLQSNCRVNVSHTDSYFWYRYLLVCTHIVWSKQFSRQAENT